MGSLPRNTSERSLRATLSFQARQPFIRANVRLLHLQTVENQLWYVALILSSSSETSLPKWRLSSSSHSFSISCPGFRGSQTSSLMLSLCIYGEQKWNSLGEEWEKEGKERRPALVLRGYRGGGGVPGVLLSVFPRTIPSLLCLCFAFYQYHQRILLSPSVGLLILPSDLWVATTLYIPAPSRLLQTQTPYLIRFSPWLRQTEIELPVYLYCSGACTWQK